MQLFADQHLASQFVEEGLEEDATALRLPVQHSLKNSGSLLFSGLQIHAAEQSGPARVGAQGVVSGMDLKH